MYSPSIDPYQNDLADNSFTLPIPFVCSSYLLYIVIVSSLTRTGLYEIFGWPISSKR